MPSIGTLSIDLEARLAKLESQMDRAARVVDAAAKRMEQAQTQAARVSEQSWTSAAAKITAAAAAMGGALLVAAQRAVAHADEMGKAARSAGIAVEQYSALAYAAQRAGVSQDQLATSMRALNRAIAESQRGEGPARIFAALGVDVRGRSQIDVLRDVAEALQRVPDPAQRAEAAMRLFGRAGSDLLPMLDQGAAGIDAMMDRARELGIVITTDVAAAAERWRDTLEDLGARMRGAVMQAIDDVMPRLVAYAQALDESSVVSDAARGVAQALSYALLGIVTVAETVAAAVRTMTAAIAASVTVMRSGLDAASIYVSRIAEAILTDATLSEALRAAAEDRAAAVAQLERDAEIAFGAARDTAQDAIDRLSASLSALWGESDRAAQSTSRIGEQSRAARGPVIDLSRALAQQERATTASARAADEWARRVGGLIDRVMSMRVDRTAKDMLDLAVALEEAERAGRAEWIDRIRDAMVELGSVINDQIIGDLERAKRAVSDYVRELEAERDLLGASSAVRRELESSLRIEEEIRRATAGLSEEQIALLEAEIERIRTLATEIETLRDARGATLERAISDAVEAGLDSASIEAFVRRLTEGVRKAFTRGAGESRASAAERISGNVLALARGLQHVVAAWRSAETGLGRVVALASLAPGPVGQVAQALQVIDAIFGGRLLGTRYQTVGQRQIISLSAEGIGGQMIDIQERQRSLFRGRRRREIARGLDPETAAQIQRVFDEIERSIGAAAAALGVRVPVIVAGRIEQEWDKDRRLVRSVSTVLGRTYQESVEDFSRRITAESLIATLDRVLGGAASEVAERYRESATDLLDAAQTLVRIQSDISRGAGLLRGEGDAIRTFEVIEALARLGEGLDAAYQRIAQAAAQLEAGIASIGILVQRGRDAFVAFASDLADLVGGATELGRLLQSAASLTDPLTRAYGEMIAAQQRAQALLAQIGIGEDEVLQRLREAVVAGDAELAASLLRVADAIAAARAAVDAYEEAVRRQRDLLAAYADEVASIDLDLLAESLSDAQRAIADARLSYLRMVESLERSARAAGLAGARTEDLSRAQELYARRLQAIAARLRADAAGIIRELGLGPLGRLEREIAALQAQAESSASTIRSAGAAWRSAAEDAASAADLLRIGDLSPLSYEQRLEEALALFRAAPTEQLARQVLELARVRFATGPEYAAIFAEVEQRLRVAGGGVDRGISGVEIGERAGEIISDRLAELMAERERLLEQQAALERAARAQELVTIIAGIAEITGQGIREIIEGLGITIEDLAEVLGVSPEEVERIIESRIGATESQVDAIVAQTQQLVDTLLTLPDETATLIWDREPGTIQRIADQQAEESRRDEERHGEVVEGIGRIEDLIGRVITKLLEDTSSSTERTARACETIAAQGSITR